MRDWKTGRLGDWKTSSYALRFPRQQGNRRAGITLIELLVASVMFLIMAAALVRAFSLALTFETELPRKSQAAERQMQFEDSISDLLRHAYLSADTTDTSSYFLTSSAVGQTNANQMSNITQGVVTLANGNSAADGIVFTVCGTRVPSRYLATTETDLQQLNDEYGPQGGVEEVGLSTTAVGDAGDNTGLFLREQRPADTDPSQGGNERVLDPDIATIGFEFFTGTDWVGTWDTTQTGDRHLPAAVRVTYTLTGDENTSHTFVVRIPLSDLTPDNPLPAGQTGGAG